MEEPYKLFFVVSDTYEMRNHLVLVGDRSDPGGKGFFEEIELRLADKQPVRVKGSVVKFATSEPGGPRAPVCIAIAGFKPSDVPIGTEVWRIETDGPVRTGRKRYEKIDRTAEREFSKSPGVALPEPVVKNKEAV